MIPQKVSDVLIPELTDLIDSGTIIDRFTQRRYLEKAEAIQEYNIRKMVCAFAYAAGGLYEDANNSFRLALQTDDGNIIRNYLTYLQKTGQIKKYMLEIIDYSGKLNTVIAQHVALNYAIFFMDYDKSKEIHDRLVKLDPHCEDKQNVMFENYKEFVEKTEDFMKAGNLKLLDVEWVNEQIIDICTQNKAIPLFVEHHVNKIDSGVAFITAIDSMDSELISTLNFQLAMKIAENDILMSNSVTGWFKSVNSERVYSA